MGHWEVLRKAHSPAARLPPPQHPLPPAPRQKAHNRWYRERPCVKLSEYHRPDCRTAGPTVTQAGGLYLCGGFYAWQPRSSHCGTRSPRTSGPFSPLTQRDLRQSSPVPGSGHSAHRQLHGKNIHSSAQGHYRRQGQAEGPAKQTPLFIYQFDFPSNVLLAATET